MHAPNWAEKWLQKKLVFLFTLKTSKVQNLCVFHAFLKFIFVTLYTDHI